MDAVTIVLFDLDGTLLDSDDALAAPFERLGVDRSEISFGQPVDAECRRLGFTVADYVAAYDTKAVQPFPGVAELIDGLDRWGICSNKAAASAEAELARLGWRPEITRFADDFEWRPKRLGPLLDDLDIDPSEVVYVGDTDHDQRCAAEVGCRFVWAGWNPRTASVSLDGVVARSPLALLDLLGLGR